MQTHIRLAIFGRSQPGTHTTEIQHQTHIRLAIFGRSQPGTHTTDDGNILPLASRQVNYGLLPEKTLSSGVSKEVRLHVANCTCPIYYACSGLHVVLALLLVELTLLLRGGVLVLLVLGDKIVHVALSLRELHLVHALARVPVQEGLPPEHPREVL